MIFQYAQQAIARPFGPGRQQYPLAGFLLCPDMIDHRVIDIAASFGAFCSKAASLPALSRNHPQA